MYLENFSNKLKKIRLSNNLTQSQLADILETTKQAISLYESGKSAPSIFILIKISEYFNISIDSLVFDKPKIDSIDLTNNLDFINELKFEIQNLKILEKNVNSFFKTFLKEGSEIPLKLNDKINNIETLLSENHLNKINNTNLKEKHENVYYNEDFSMYQHKIAEDTDEYTP